jgi:MFS family permease
MRAAGLREWLKAKDPSFVAIKRAVRVTLAACAAFYFSLYVLDNTQMATFASFGCIALGALSEVTGTPWQRTKTYGAALLAGMILVTLGTVLAINTWAAVAGMLGVGFAIAYAGVGGPRVVGAANGLQLLYILPSFPPYLPDALGSRLMGLVLAVGLLAIADRVLWPPPVPTPFRHRLAAAIHAVRDRLVALLESDGVRHSPAQSDAQSDTGGAIGLRLSRIPPLERPTGPGRRDRAAMEATTILHGLESRIAALTELTEQSQGSAAHAQGMHLLSVAAQSLGQSAEALDRPPDGGGPDLDSTPVDSALSKYVQWRETLSHPTAVDRVVRMRLRFAVAAEELSVWTRDLAVTVRIMKGKRLPETSRTSIAEPFWYANRSALWLWFMRFRGHFTPRSVFFQNAIRLAVGLAAARLAAGVLDLSHGFWMLLATLTLMRTSVATTRAAVVPAFLGTVAGGLVAALVLAVAGADSTVYEVAFPFVMVLALAAGPLAGPIAGQALFTLLVAMLFAQMAPVSWRLAEVRILDVVLGGLLGAVVGLLVWPRGASGEMRRTARATLNAAANDLESTVESLTHREVAASGQPDTASVAVRFLMLADSTLAQYRSELRGTSDHVDWLGVLGLAQEVVGGGQVLRRTHGTAGPLPWPHVAADLNRLGAGTADQLRRIAHLVGTDAGRSRASPEPTEDVDAWMMTSEAQAVARRETDPASAVRVLDLWGWLAGVSFDSRRMREIVTRAIDPLEGESASQCRGHARGSPRRGRQRRRQP